MCVRACVRTCVRACVRVCVCTASHCTCKRTTSVRFPASAGISLQKLCFVDCCLNIYISLPPPSPPLPSLCMATVIQRGDRDRMNDPLRHKMDTNGEDMLPGHLARLSPSGGLPDSDRQRGREEDITAGIMPLPPDPTPPTPPPRPPSTHSHFLQIYEETRKPCQLSPCALQNEAGIIIIIMNTNLVVDRADRLAGKATLTTGLLLGRSEVLRSLRHYLRSQSQKTSHH